MAVHFHDSSLLISEHGIYTREREEELIKADWVKGAYKNMSQAKVDRYKEEKKNRKQTIKKEKRNREL